MDLKGPCRIRAAGVDGNGSELREWISEPDEVAGPLTPGWSAVVRLPDGFADGSAEIRAFLSARLDDSGTGRPVSLQGRPVGN